MDFLSPHLKVLFARMCCFLAGLVLTALFPVSRSFHASLGEMFCVSMRLQSCPSALSRNWVLRAMLFCRG